MHCSNGLIQMKVVASEGTSIGALQYGGIISAY